MIPSASGEVRDLLRTRDGQATGLRDGQSLLQDRTGTQRGSGTNETKRAEKSRWLKLMIRETLN